MIFSLTGCDISLIPLSWNFVLRKKHNRHVNQCHVNDKCRVNGFHIKSRHPTYSYVTMYKVWIIYNGHDTSVIWILPARLCWRQIFVESTCSEYVGAPQVCNLNVSPACDRISSFQPDQLILAQSSRRGPYCWYLSKNRSFSQNGTTRPEILVVT